MRALVRLITTLAMCAALIGVAHAQTAPPGNVLFIGIHGADNSYDNYGVLGFQQLQAYVGAANATYMLLTSNGQVAAHLATPGVSYQQIWVYDLAYNGDAYPADVAAIAQWYANHPTKHIICDGRILGSFYAGRETTEGRKIVENYFYNLATRGGGLILSTDHNEYADGFTNPLGAAIGIGPFTGNFGGSFPLDQNHPVATTPNIILSLSNDTTTGQAPFGLQTNGKVLHTFGYHSGNTATPGISSTIDGSLSVKVVIDSPTDGAVFCDEQSVVLASTPSQGTPPYTYEWTSSLAGSLGTSEDLTVPLASLVEGTHTLTVTIHDAQGRVDNDTVIITIGGDACEEACGAGTEVCLEDDGTLFTIGLVGPSGPAYAVCRIVPQGFGQNPAAQRYLDCEDVDGNGTVDVYTPAQIVARFGAGYCGN